MLKAESYRSTLDKNSTINFVVSMDLLERSFMYISKLPKSLQRQQFLIVVQPDVLSSTIPQESI